MYEIKHESLTPNNFYAGNFPIVTESGTIKSNATIRKYAPVIKGTDGIEEAGEDNLDKLVGIAADEPSNDKIVYHTTGEFFKDAIELPSGVTIEALQTACRKLSIFLK